MALKTLQYELSGWRGMDRWTPETEVDPHFWYDLQNMDCDEGGVTAKRRGATGIPITISGTIQMIYDHQSQQGFTTSTDIQRTIIIAGTTLNVVKSFSQPGQTIDATFTVTNARHYAVSDDVGVGFFTNENGGDIKMLAYVGNNWIYQNADLVAPSGTITVTTGATVSFTFSGTFQAQESYVDIWGNESPLSAESSGVSLSNQALDIAKVPSNDPTVDYIKFYVLGPGMSDYQFSGTSTNTSGTYSHSMSMAELMAGDLAPSYLVPAPPAKYITIYEDMILAAGDTNAPDAVYAGNRQFHRQWSDNFARCVTGDGQPIRGFGDSFDRKLVVKADSLHLCEGEHQDDFRTRIYSKRWGAVSQAAVSFASNRMAWFSDDGAYIDNGQEPQETSRQILGYLRTMDSRNIEPFLGQPSKLVSDCYKYYRQTYFSLREYDGQQGENNVLLVWNYQYNTWTKYTGNVPCAIGSIQNQDDYEYLYGGDANGKVWLFSPPNYFASNDDAITSTASTTISCVAETPWINLPKLKGLDDWERSRTIPRYLEVYASGQPAQGETEVDLDCEYYVDFDKDNVIASFPLKFKGHTWPDVRPYKQTISYGGMVGTFKWVKWKFTHAYLGQHIRIHKLVFGFKAKPSVD